jgi:hypothetical protein
VKAPLWVKLVVLGQREVSWDRAGTVPLSQLFKQKDTITNTFKLKIIPGTLGHIKYLFFKVEKKIWGCLCVPEAKIELKPLVSLNNPGTKFCPRAVPACPRVVLGDIY